MGALLPVGFTIENEKMGVEYLLRVNKVSKIFGYGFLGKTKFRAVDKVSFALDNKPQILTIAGESGCGKTTLCKMILGFLEPDEGSIEYMGKDINKLKSKELIWFRREVQGIFQDPYETFNPLKRVESYLYETAKNIAWLKEKNEASRRIEEVLEFVGLSLNDIKGKYSSEFSGGQLQRISVARALLSNPRLIVADEPISMLDASLRMNVINIFKKLKEKHGVSFIYITHDLSTAYYISDYILIMYRGTVVEEGPVDIVLKYPKHPYTSALLLSLPEPRKREIWLKESEIYISEMEIKEFLTLGCRYAFICPYRDERCSKERPPAFMVNGAMVACWLYER
jgi:peptide/nickel transport system ATP-binding protein